MKKVLILAVLVVIVAVLAGCTSDADVASQNISKSADNFQIARRIVFYNGITNDYILVIEDYCSLGNTDGPKELTVTCKTGDGQYKKHFLGLSDNVTYFAEQVDASLASTSFYKVIFKPSSIIPDIELR